ncbi:MAG: sulfotransferase family protein, partial [Polymorphobacter sp.]
PSFARHCETTDQTPAYTYLRQLLQLASWFSGRDPHKPFVLKMPQHMQDLPALMTHFPDARLVFIHRDPATIVASGASLVWNQMVVQSDHVDPHWIGAEWLHKTRYRDTVTAKCRPTIAATQQIDVRFADMNADWAAVMARIYAFLGLEFDAVTQAAMAAYMRRSAAEHKHHQHRYDLADFGLEPDSVNAHFAGYRARHDIPIEGAAAKREAASGADRAYSVSQGATA